MSPRTGMPRRGARLPLTLSLLAALCVQPMTSMPSGAPARDPLKQPTLTDNYDIRIHGVAQLESLLKDHLPGLAGRPAREAGQIKLDRSSALARLRAARPEAEASESPLTGGVEVVRAARAGLTDAAPARKPADVAIDFIADNADLYGLSEQQARALHVVAESAGGDGLSMVRVEQRLHGLPVFQSETRALIDRQGRLVRTVGRLLPGLDDSEPSPDGALPASAALKAALASIGLEVDEAAMKSAPAAGAGDLDITVADPEITDQVTSWQVWFPAGPGTPIPARAFIVITAGPGDWYMLVDATAGTILYRKNIELNASTHEARFSVYAQADGSPADSPAPASPNTLTPGGTIQFGGIARSIVSMLALQSIVASPNGWIPDGGQTTTGNNADAFLDRNGDNVPDALLDASGRPVGNPDINIRNRDFLGTVARDFNYSPAPSGGNPDAGDSPGTAPSQRGMLTQLFYIANWYHDKVYALGFDEASGNYQTDNFGRGGLGGDAVRLQAQFGIALTPPQGNNANFSSPPDGTAPRLRAYIFPGPTPDRDVGLDAEVMIHELTHGLTQRLVGNVAGLNWGPGAGMGEGWSDFYALSLLNNQPGDNPNGQYGNGAWITYRLGGLTENYLYGIRMFPYTTDNSINPLTWADVDDLTDNTAGGIPPSPLGFQFNSGSEVHNTGEVWAVSLWEVRSRIIAANGGNVPVGNGVMLRIVTDALKMTPLDPSFTEARDALLDADCALNACANETAIWGGFADRGLGYRAEASLGTAIHPGVKESFGMPRLDVAGVTIADTNDGYIDPAEPITLTVSLTNPWRQASRGVASVTATLTSSTPGVVITDGSAVYGPIPAGGSAAGDIFQFTVDAGAACGLPLSFTLQTTSSLGTTAAQLTLRVGAPQGPGAPVTFTRTHAPGLGVPDSSPLGTVSTLLVAPDLEIADIDVRIDSLTHTWVGDMNIAVKGPGGLGVDLVYLPGECNPTCFLGANAGDNFTNTVLNDSSTRDLLVAGTSQAPFTGDWKAVMNSPSWVDEDPVGQLGHYNGTSTQGDWQLFLSDLGAQDFGILNGWSLLVRPMVYTCCAVTGQADADMDGFRLCDGDCDDTRASVGPGATQICGDGLNNDCSAPGWPSLAGTNEADDDGDGLTECQGDCNDASAAIRPGAPEICDGLDNNCNGSSDEGADGDSDGVSIVCDCNDASAVVYPGAPQTCDGLNNNCNAPGWPSLAGTNEADDDTDTFTECQGDCQDGNPAIYPGAPEVCDGLDNDCDTAVDEGLDADGDNFTSCAGDCDDANNSVFPGAPQVCDGVNNNCAATGWPSLAGTNEADDDADGYTECQNDCADNDPSRNPAALDICDGVDNNCNGQLEETTDVDGDNQAACAGDCQPNNPAIYSGAPQICDGINNDCATFNWPALAQTNEADDDGDGFSECQQDCSDADGSVWMPPSEPLSLALTYNVTTGQTALAWSPSTQPGASSVFYDVLRTRNKNNFVAPTVCLEINDGSDTAAIDSVVPIAGTGFFFLVRGENLCPASSRAGADSNGVAIPARNCP